MVEDMDKDGQVFFGTVVFFVKGYGFIACDDGSEDKFCHYSDIEMENFKTLRKGQRVSFQLGLNLRNQVKAIRVKVLINPGTKQ